MLPVPEALATAYRFSVRRSFDLLRYAQDDRSVHFLNWVLTNPILSGYNGVVYEKSCEEKSRHYCPVREPRKVGGGTEKNAEHGLGAGLSIGRQLRLRCVISVLRCVHRIGGLPRQCAHWLAMTSFFFCARINQGGTASIFVALGSCPRAAFILGKR